MNIFQEALAWLKKEFAVIKIKIVPVVITIVEAIKSVEDNGVLSAIAAVLNTITDGISVEVNSWLQLEIPRVLAVLLGIENLPVNPTQDQIVAFENAVVTAIAGLNALDRSKVWTLLSSELYISISAKLHQDNGTLTYADIISLINEGFKDYQAAVATPPTQSIGATEEAQREALKG